MEKADSKNHHWLPQFMMRPWVSDVDGKVESFFHNPVAVESRRKSTKCLGSIDHLYRIDAPSIDPNVFENAFASLENTSATIRDLLLNEGPSALTSEQRDHFAAMIAFLYFRRPEMVHSKIDLAKGIMIEKLTACRKELEATGQFDPIEWHLATTIQAKVIVLQEALRVAYEIGTKVAKLPWRIIHFQESHLRLVLGDRPIVATGTIADGITWLKVPLGPQALFVAGTADFDDQYRTDLRDGLMVSEIADQFRRCARFVIGVSRAPYISLAEKYLTLDARPALPGTL